MRIGLNPEKDKEIFEKEAYHRVIIPIYIPHQKDYFKESLEVLKVCLFSLMKTINSDTKVSLISNGSCDEVNVFLKVFAEKNEVDRLIINRENIGKMNALITETRASFEKFITFSDADVFFDKDWLLNTYKVFNTVKQAGYVSMNPTPVNLTLANSTLFYNLFKFNIKKQKVYDTCNVDDLRHFHKSIGRPKEYTEAMLQKNVCLLKKWNYIVGAGHFCCTIKKEELLKFVPITKSNIAASGGSETRYLDLPFDKCGLYKVSSPKAYIWHLGNTIDQEWVTNKVNALQEYREEAFSFNNIAEAKTINIMPYALRVLMIRILKKLNFFK